MNIYRHGDISFHPRNASEIPEGCRMQKLDRYVVAYGEATGHHHELRIERDSDSPELPDLPIMTLYTAPDGRRFITVEGNAIALTHPEHRTLNIVPGCYEIQTEQTFDYFENSIKRVVD